MSDFPFRVQELDRPTAGLSALFQRCFATPPPEEPRHFVAMLEEGAEPTTAAYIHYIEFESGVYLCGGLCVDSRLYRRMNTEQRRAIAKVGSLSRWLSNESIAALGAKRAVFAYTGSTYTRRDAFALDFIPAAGNRLLVQWHDEPEDRREALVERIVALGAF